jgi:DNA-binding beta-propeller fold protein YncE
MAHRARIASTFAIGVLALTVVQAQISTSPFRVNYDWLKLQNRKIGTLSGMQMDRDGQHIWIMDRCGGNGCAESDLDPIMELDLEGKLVKSFGRGLIAFPHGFFIDPQGYIWVTEGAPAGDARGEAGFKKKMGHQVLKFSPDGKIVMRLGEAGVSGADETHFNGPTGVVIADNGDIWITDGHGGPQRGPNRENMFGSRGGNNRLVRFSKDGKFIKSWGGGIGSESHDPLRFNDPHGIARDAEGRLYVADRGNIRVQVLDTEGTFITQWTQFGKPSAIAIDARGNIYVADGMSDTHWNPGWERGIRVGDIKTGWIKAFIPDEEVGSGAGTEFLGVDGKGNIYSGASGRAGLVLHQLFRPLF